MTIPSPRTSRGVPPGDPGPRETVTEADLGGLSPLGPSEMLMRQLRTTARGLSEAAAAQRLRQFGPNELSKRAFYPLTMPLTVGPGSMSVALTLGANPEPGLRSKVVTAMAHTVGILIVAVAVYLCYRHADRIVKQLGPTGTSVVVRLSAFILLCIGVQIIWNGARALLVGAFPGAAP